MFATNTIRCPISFYKMYLEKRPISLRASGPLYLSIIHNPTSQVWYKNMPMGQHTINSIMKNMVANSPLRTSSKKLTNHSARKTVVKKLKKHHVPKSDIIGITGHTTEAGLDAYDSGDEKEQKSISNFIDNVPSEEKQHKFKPRDSLIQPSHPLLQKPSFDFFNLNLPNPLQPSSSSSTFASNPNIFNFNNCTVNFHGNAPKNPSKRKRHIIYSSDSSQD